MVAPVSKKMLLAPRIVPTKSMVVLRVVSLPTCQKTLQAWAAPVSNAWLPAAVTRLDVAWKAQTAFGSPSPSSVRVPMRLAVVAAGNRYTPAVRVCPPSWLSPATKPVSGVCAKALLYAVSKSALAVSSRGSSVTKQGSPPPLHEAQRCQPLAEGIRRVFDPPVGEENHPRMQGSIELPTPQRVVRQHSWNDTRVTPGAFDLE